VQLDLLLLSEQRLHHRAKPVGNEGDRRSLAPEMTCQSGSDILKHMSRNNCAACTT